MRLNTLFIFFLFTLPFVGYSQFDTPSSNNEAPIKKPVKEKKEPLSDRMIVGGGLDLAIGDIVSVGVTPIIAFEATKSTWVGGAFTYRYFENRLTNPTYSTHTYGAAPFVRQHVFEYLFVHAEYEFLNGQWQFNRENEWVSNFMIGPGYRAFVGDRSFFSVYLLWVVSEDPVYQIYNQPILRMNFAIGL